MAGKHHDDTSMNGHPRIFLSLPELLKYEDVLGPVSNHIGSTDKQHVKDERGTRRTCLPLYDMIHFVYVCHGIQKGSLPRKCPEILATSPYTGYFSSIRPEQQVYTVPPLYQLNI